MDDQRSVRRDQGTNGVVLALEQGGAIERASQGVIEGAVAVAVHSRRIGAAGSSEFASSACAPAPAQRSTTEIANALGISRGDLVVESAIQKNLLLHIIACVLPA